MRKNRSKVFETIRHYIERDYIIILNQPLTD